MGCLTDEDLNEVLRARAEAKAVVAAKAKAVPTGGDTAGQSRSPALRRSLTAKEMGGAGVTPGLRRRAERDSAGSPDPIGLRQRLESRRGDAE